LGRSNQVIVINPEAEGASAPAGFPTVRVGLDLWAFFFLSLVLTASVVAVLVYFYKEPPPALSTENLLSRFNHLATCAIVLGGLAVSISVATFYYAKHKRYDQRALVRIAGVAAIGLAAAVFVASFFCWTKTERVTALSPIEPAADDSLPRRLHSATTVIRALDTRVDRYRAAKGSGVIVGTKAGRTWILTVPYPDEDSWRNLPRAEALWVNFSDGRSLPARLRWAAEPPLNLAIIEVSADAPTGQVQFHPLAEAVIPSAEVLVVHNPLSAGWKLERGIVLKRHGLRTKSGWNGLVEVDLNPRRDDVGSGIYDERGRLLGLNAGFDRVNDTTKFVIISSDVIRGITAAAESDNFDALEAISLDGRMP
jgi:hypothetical protein